MEGEKRDPAINIHDTQEIGSGGIPVLSGDARKTAPRTVCVVVNVTKNPVTMRLRRVNA